MPSAFAPPPLRNWVSVTPCLLFGDRIPSESVQVSKSVKLNTSSRNGNIQATKSPALLSLILPNVSDVEVGDTLRLGDASRGLEVYFCGSVRKSEKLQGGTWPERQRYAGVRHRHAPEDGKPRYF